MNNQAPSKRMTFQGVINSEKEKVPERSSRSRSKSRTKATSITKSANGISNTSRSWRKTEPMKATSNNRSEVSKTSSDNIFREKRKNQQQELMKKIIKLKNHSTKIENIFKDQLSVLDKSADHDKKCDNKEDLKLQQMHTFLQEFDVQIRKQTKIIGDSYFKQLEEEESLLEKQEIKVPEYKYITIPHVSPEMQKLESKLEEMEKRWMK